MPDKPHATIYMDVEELDAVRSACRLKIKKLKKDMSGLTNKNRPVHHFENRIKILEKMVTVLSGYIFKLVGTGDFNAIPKNERNKEIA